MDEIAGTAPCRAGDSLPPPPMAADRTVADNHALARATSLVSRARKLRGAQAEVQELTAREVQLMARTAASFFDAVPLTEFAPRLFPPTARSARRTRHRIVHHTIQQQSASVLIRALLLGRDGVLRLFTARSAGARELLQLLEPGGMTSGTVVRDVVEWSPGMRVPGFRPFEILDKLSASLDVVDGQLAAAEARVQVQKAALVSGNLSALLPGTASRSKPASDHSSQGQGSVVEPTAAALEPEAPVPLPVVEPYLLTELGPMDEAAVEAAMLSAFREEPMPAPAMPEAAGSVFDLFQKVESVAASVAPSRAVSAPSESDFLMDDEPANWDDPI